MWLKDQYKYGNNGNEDNGICRNSGNRVLGTDSTDNTDRTEGRYIMSVGALPSPPKRVRL